MKILNTRKNFYAESRCVKTCPRSYFPDPVWKICRSCPAHCLNCFDRDSCEQCNKKSFLMISSNSTEHAGKIQVDFLVSL